MAGCTGRLHGVVREAVPIKETTGCIIVQMKHPAVFDLIFWPAVVATEGKIVLHRRAAEGLWCTHAPGFLDAGEDLNFQHGCLLEVRGGIHAVLPHCGCPSGSK